MPLCLIPTIAATWKNSAAFSTKTWSSTTTKAESLWGGQALTDSIKKNICGGDVRRELVPGSLQIYYMKGYGAVEIGIHRFLHPKSNGATGEGRFISLWQYKEGAWKITRAISYDHHLADAK
jgi:Domain of unknown function (DUF4440)